MSEQFITSVSRQLLEVVACSEALMQQLDFSKVAVKEMLQVETAVLGTARKVRQALLSLEDGPSDSLLNMWGWQTCGDLRLNKEWMHQDYGTIIYIALPNTRLRSPPGVFAAKYTVADTQEYEIQFARVGCSAAQSVFRRFRQFHHLYRSIQSLGFTDPPDVPFPSKQVLRPLSASVITHRRQRLEQWLRSVAASLFCHTFVYEFLGLTGAQPLESHMQNAAELCITTTIHRLLSEPHMKLAALENFDQRFFPQSRAVQIDFLVVFLNFLLPIVSDDHAGARALQVLRSLVSRTQFKGSSEVAALLPSLPREAVRSARFDAHILERLFRDTREDACEVFKVLYEECIPDGKESVSDLVTPTQLNNNAEAFELFVSWLKRLDDCETAAPHSNETQWAVKLGSGSELTVKLRAVDRDVEVEVHLTVDANLTRMLDVILKPDLRRLWDHRLSNFQIAQLSGTDYSLEFMMEAAGVMHSFQGALRIVRESDSHVFVFFETPDKQLRNSYEISVREWNTKLQNLPLSTKILPCFEDTESSDWSTPRFNALEEGSDYQGDFCHLTVKSFGGETVARFLLGDDDVLIETWKRFKIVAEGDVPETESDREETLHEALSRKTLRSASSAKKRTEELADSLLPSYRKLERRMFL